ncbi:DUF2306 domain-containing protein [Hymenobacter sp. HD11105]
MKKQSFYVWVWVILIGLNLFYIYTFPLKYFTYASLQKAFGPLLLLHIIFAMVALLIGPLQFFASIRKRYLSLHQWAGRIYLFSILVAALAAIVLAIKHNIQVQHNLIFGTGMLGLAAAWLLTSGMALWAIKNRNFGQHQEWMIKSYVVTCGFTTYRLFAVTLSGFVSFDHAVMSGIMAWACWSVPLLLTEVILEARKIQASGLVKERPPRPVVLSKVVSDG